MVKMNPRELRRRLVGVIAFPVTPFRADGSLDRPGLRSNLRRLLRHPIAAVVAPGGTGEIYSLTADEHEAVVREAVRESGGRVPVIAGAGFGVPAAAQMARRAARSGASGILAFPPLYPNADEEGLLEYYRAIGAATKLGMIIYSRDWFDPGPAFVERLCRIPTLVAWKEGQAGLRRLQQIMHRVGDRLAWVGGAGDDMVPGYYALGIRAYTSSIANLSPRLAVELHEAAAHGAAARLEGLMRDFVLPLFSLRGRRRGYEVSVMKAMMKLLGMAAGPVRPPLASLRPAELRELRALLPAWKRLP